jgi:hypothetical protein
MSINAKLQRIQSNLKVPKSQFNAFGRYKYRSCEDILEALKPHLEHEKCIIFLNDTIEMIGNRFYIKAVATLVDTESEARIDTEAFAREEESKKGMDGSQVTGASSSYARKYALNGMFLIDDSVDSDTINQHGKEDSNLISESQKQRLFKLGENKIKEVKEIFLKYGYTASTDIKKDDYNAICSEVEALS